ncbi:flagellar biosynthesis anti-sigma factor FlgM [Halobacillus fulvus]|nr:flagellar biosynthesis anti-sigma factor FlgM [Halobacillus fulvus]
MNNKPYGIRLFLVDSRGKQETERSEVNAVKINGPNHSHLNPYQKQFQKQADAKQQTQRQDKIEISQQAKEMQGAGKADAARERLVQEIKMDVESGTYKVDANTIAKKMIDFYKK